MKHLLLLILSYTPFILAAEQFSHLDGRNYYQILGVERSASQEDIKKAYRKLMMKYHPDRKGGNADKAKNITQAYNIIGDHNKRINYDMWLSEGSDTASGRGYEDETSQRERELQKNASYVLNEAAKVRAQYPHETLDQMVEHGRSHVIYVMRFMPDANYTTEELWRLINEFGQIAFEKGQITEDAFAMLAGGALQYLKERADNGNFYGEKGYLQRMDMTLDRKLQGLQNGHNTVWNTLWKILSNGRSFYHSPPVTQNCSSSLTQVLRFTHNGIVYEIPISISISLGK